VWKKKDWKCFSAELLTRSAASLLHLSNEIHRHPDHDHSEHCVHKPVMHVGPRPFPLACRRQMMAFFAFQAFTYRRIDAHMTLEFLYGLNSHDVHVQIYCAGALWAVTAQLALENRPCGLSVGSGKTEDMNLADVIVRNDGFTIFNRILRSTYYEDQAHIENETQNHATMRFHNHKLLKCWVCAVIWAILESSKAGLVAFIHSPLADFALRTVSQHLIHVELPRKPYGLSELVVEVAAVANVKKREKRPLQRLALKLDPHESRLRHLCMSIIRTALAETTPEDENDEHLGAIEYAYLKHLYDKHQFYSLIAACIFTIRKVVLDPHLSVEAFTVLYYLLQGGSFLRIHFLELFERIAEEPFEQFICEEYLRARNPYVHVTAGLICATLSADTASAIKLGKNGICKILSGYIASYLDPTQAHDKEENEQLSLECLVLAIFNLTGAPQNHRAICRHALRHLVDVCKHHEGERVAELARKALSNISKSDDRFVKQRMYQMQLKLMSEKVVKARVSESGPEGSTAASLDSSEITEGSATAEDADYKLSPEDLIKVRSNFKRKLVDNVAPPARPATATLPAIAESDDGSLDKARRRATSMLRRRSSIRSVDMPTTLEEMLTGRKPGELSEASSEDANKASPVIVASLTARKHDNPPMHIPRMWGTSAVRHHSIANFVVGKHTVVDPDSEGSEEGDSEVRMRRASSKASGRFSSASPQGDEARRPSTVGHRSAKDRRASTMPRRESSMSRGGGATGRRASTAGAKTRSNSVTWKDTQRSSSGEYVPHRERSTTSLTMPPSNMSSSNMSSETQPPTGPNPWMPHIQQTFFLPGADNHKALDIYQLQPYSQSPIVIFEKGKIYSNPNTQTFFYRFPHVDGSRVSVGLPYIVDQDGKKYHVFNKPDPFLMYEPETHFDTPTTAKSRSILRRSFLPLPFPVPEEQEDDVDDHAQPGAAWNLRYDNVKAKAYITAKERGLHLQSSQQLASMSHEGQESEDAEERERYAGLLYDSGARHVLVRMDDGPSGEKEGPAQVDNFDLAESIWGPRERESEAKDFYNTQMAWQRTFATQYRRLLSLTRFWRLLEQNDENVASGAKTVEKESKNVAKTLFKLFPSIYQAFVYCVCRHGDMSSPYTMSISVQPMQFYNFCAELVGDELVPPRQKNQVVQELCGLYAYVNTEEDRKSDLAEYNLNAAFMHHEFLEAVVRMAVVLYKRTFPQYAERQKGATAAPEADAGEAEDAEAAQAEEGDQSGTESGSTEGSTDVSSDEDEDDEEDAFDEHAMLGAPEGPRKAAEYQYDAPKDPLKRYTDRDPINLEEYSVSNALEYFAQEIWAKNLPDFVFNDNDVFRRKWAYTNATNEAFLPHLDNLHAIFTFYATNNKAKAAKERAKISGPFVATFSLGEWEKFLTTVGLLNDNTSPIYSPSYGRTHAKRCFLWSRMLVRDDLLNKDSFTSVTPTGFFEALARVCHARYAPFEDMADWSRCLSCFLRYCCIRVARENGGTLRISCTGHGLDGKIVGNMKVLLSEDDFQALQPTNRHEYRRRSTKKV